MNFGLTSGDKEEKVSKNLSMLARNLCVNVDSFVFAGQEHGSKIAVVNEKTMETPESTPAGKRFIVNGADAMITDMAGVNLITLHADCAPVYLFDPAKPAVGLVHSGWKGTLADIVKLSILEMTKQYGTDPANVIAAIGPSIGKCCFETREDVYGKFLKRLPWTSGYIETLTDSVSMIDLKGIIRHQLLAAGIEEEHLYVSDLCTACRNDLFFSHRATKGATGRMAAVIGLKGGS
jgi:YfiH family protein